MSHSSEDRRALDLAGKECWQQFNPFILEPRTLGQLLELFDQQLSASDLGAPRSDAPIFRVRSTLAELVHIHDEHPGLDRESKRLQSIEVVRCRLNHYSGFSLPERIYFENKEVSRKWRVQAERLSSTDEMEKISRAHYDPIAFDDLCRLANTQVLQDQITDEIRHFLLMLTGQTLQRPTERANAPETSAPRDYAIFRLFCLAHDCGHTPTRNDVTEVRDSACDIVAEALKVEDLKPPSYSRVKEIYVNIKSNKAVG